MRRDERTVRVQEIPPAAARTIRSFRDIGYDLRRAVADLVDNSLSAGATRVSITLEFEGPDSWIRIADDGVGMDAGELLEAMRYGSERRYEEADLGRFGFGLKTASTSQCRRLTVASRPRAGKSNIEIRCLDLDHIEASDRWEVLVLDESNVSQHLLNPIENNPGTVVLWEKLDRILHYKDPFGDWAHRRMLELAEEIDRHLSMVFHRFLGREVEGRSLLIDINGSDIEPWDPFCRDEPSTATVSDISIPISTSTGSGMTKVRAFVLPHQSEFSSRVAWSRASGPAKWNRQQGLYIYRAHRLIQSGGWNRMRTVDEHTKLARIAIDFFPNLDMVFNLNIMKASVGLPDDLRTYLDPIVKKTVEVADRRYRDGKSKSKPAPQPRYRPSPPAQTDEPVTGDPMPLAMPKPSPWPIDPQVVLPHTASRARIALEDAADSIQEVDALVRIIEALSSRHPEVAHELGW